jgi:hypothetical protein
MDSTPNTINRFLTRQQIEAVRQYEPDVSFFVQAFFGGEPIYSPTETVEWDVVREGASMARYINRYIGTTPTEREAYNVKEITTPLVRESRILTAEMLSKRLPGENVYSMQTPAQRAGIMKAQDFQFCINAIERRREQQASQLITRHYVEIIGEGVNDFIDFSAEGLRKVKTGTSTWDSPNVKWEDDIEDASEALLARGHAPAALIVGQNIYRFLRNDPRFRESLDITNMNAGNIDPERKTTYGQARYVGTITLPNVLDVYVVNAKYKDFDNTIKWFLEPNDLIVTSDNSSINRFVFGAYTTINESGVWMTEEGRYIPEHFIRRDPPAEELRVSSRPMPIPTYIDSWYVITALQS